MTGVTNDHSEDRPFPLGGILVEPALNRLSSQDRVITIEPKVMSLLVCLASRPGEVVRQREIRSAVWGNVHVVDGVLARAAYRLRNALAKAGADGLAIETIRGSGYRLVERPAEASGSPPSPARRTAFWRDPRLGWASTAVFGIAIFVIAMQLVEPVTAPRPSAATPGESGPAGAVQAAPQREDSEPTPMPGPSSARGRESVAPRAPVTKPTDHAAAAAPAAVSEAPRAVREEAANSETPSPTPDSRRTRPAAAAPTPVADPS